MNIIRIHHVAIICSDYEVSKNFYTNMLGFKIIKETFRESRNSYKLDLRVGETDILELFSFQSCPPRQNNPEGCGLRHLAFLVNDLDAEIEKLATLKIEVEPVRVDEITGKRFTFFKDPDDLPLEIYEE